MNGRDAEGLREYRMRQKMCRSMRGWMDDGWTDGRMDGIYEWKGKAGWAK